MSTTEAASIASVLKKVPYKPIVGVKGTSNQPLKPTPRHFLAQTVHTNHPCQTSEPTVTPRQASDERRNSPLFRSGSPPRGDETHVTHRICPQSATTTLFLVAPLLLPIASIFFTTSYPLTTLPKTTCLPSSQEVFTVVRKNCASGTRTVTDPIEVAWRQLQRHSPHKADFFTNLDQRDNSRQAFQYMNFHSTFLATFNHQTVTG